ncbi:hypothetical protein OE749_15835 [Aestuariibacter sp. AA17]|uniref:PBP domain-containing protein n=1 Tax=Fluctibacter corallii TaxID=2984329 RepID=A0ABT3AC14_9ALTE|nr:hypothetical protein [Aestuariibacter sp. AA17]MCV2886164.1 hypothetical protein [Aestuariibacter sp. AA17]
MDSFGYLRCLFIALVLFAVPAVEARNDNLQVVVITNASVSSHALSTSQLRRVFSMRQLTWPDGQSMRVFVLNNKHEAHEAFCVGTLNMFPYQLERMWNKLIYSGLGEAPTEVASLDEMLEKVMTTPGAIGYVPSSIVPSENIQIIRLEEG